MDIYVVEMLRWGSRELHTYVHGVYDNEKLARQEAKTAEEDRGGKYEAEILKLQLNNSRMEGKIIHRSCRELLDPIPASRKLEIGDEIVNIQGDLGTVIELGEPWNDCNQDAKVSYPAIEKWHHIENLEKY